MDARRGGWRILVHDDFLSETLGLLGLHEQTKKLLKSIVWYRMLTICAQQSTKERMVGADSFCSEIEPYFLMDEREAIEKKRDLKGLSIRGH